MKIPFIPDAAPFNEDQKAWLSGFLAGLHSRAAMNNRAENCDVASAAQAAQPQIPELNILVGTQTGTAEMLAEEAADMARAKGLSPVIASLDDISMEQLSAMRVVIVVISTYGEGEMPDNAGLFWGAVSSDTAPRLENVNFAVLALGDTGYDEFCQAGKLVDMRFEQLGATRLLARVDCDVDYEEPSRAWLENMLPLARECAGSDLPEPTGTDSSSPEAQTSAAKRSEWGRKNPYMARVVENRLLSGVSSAKEIRHFSFSLGESGMSYEAGDALGVLPVNDPVLVAAILEKLDIDPETPVSKFDMSIAEAMRTRLEIMTPSKDLVKAISERAKDDELSTILANGDKEAMDTYLWGKDTLDLLNLSPDMDFTYLELVDLLKPLQHRAYSISSSPKAHAGEVHLTVAAVRWKNGGREHKGVCSTYLADGVEAGDEAPVFISPNKSFRVPEDDSAPIIMVGPGTGIAPFRAFLEERQARGATGKNWLFFGDQHRAHDFIYEDEISKMSADGLLTRLDLAFSRDQNEKVYVQSRMLENGKELFSWLEEGASFYVCGDATRMAKDVDDTLHCIITENGAMSQDQASEYVDNMKREKRYLRDVY